MQRRRLALLVVMFVSSFSMGTYGEDCSKCRCTSYPVPKECENCCRVLPAASKILDETMSTPDRAIPSFVLRAASCVAVVPGMKKGGFIVGTQQDVGVVTCRTGRGWSAPALIQIAGGATGFQIGGQETDLIMVTTGDRGMQDFLRGKFRIGANLSAAAGPVGRDAAASTDAKLNTELLTWSRSRGLFAGVDLNGATVSVSDPSILREHAPESSQAQSFVSTVARYFRQSELSPY